MKIVKCKVRLDLIARICRRRAGDGDDDRLGGAGQAKVRRG